MDWKEYYAKTKNSKPNFLLEEAFKHVQKGTVLDLGAGSLKDSLFLKSKGFDVVSVDKEPLEPVEGLTVVQSDYKDFNYGKYDLVCAFYSLPFAGKNFNEVFEKLRSTKAVLAFQLFGNRDEWKTVEGLKDKLTFHSKEEVGSLLEGFKVLYFKEEERVKPTAAGTSKHWHVFHVVATPLD